MSEEKETSRIYEFGPFRLDAAERLLLRDGVPVMLAQKDGAQTMLTPKVVETLLALVERGGQIVGKDELMKAVWPDTIVEEGNLAANISLLRKALGTAEQGQPYIETFPKRGYRFNAGVRSVAKEDTAVATRPPDQLETIEATGPNADIIIRKRTRTHVVARVANAKDYDAASLPAPAGTVARQALVHDIEPVKPQRSFWRTGLIVAALLLVSGVIVAGVFLIRRTSVLTAKTSQPFTLIRISRLTANGTASQSAISPDGQYAIYVTGGAGQQRLQLRHIATGSEQEIVAPSKETLSGVSFSRDGRNVYYIRYSEKEAGMLWQTPTLGGAPRLGTNR